MDFRALECGNLRNRMIHTSKRSRDTCHFVVDVAEGEQRLLLFLLRSHSFRYGVAMLIKCDSCSLRASRCSSVSEPRSGIKRLH